MIWGETARTAADMSSPRRDARRDCVPPDIPIRGMLAIEGRFVCVRTQHIRYATLTPSPHRRARLEVDPGLFSPVPGVSVEELPVSEAQPALGSESVRFLEGIDRWTPLHDPSYVVLWAQILGPPEGCRIVLARDRSGDLLAYAPLMRVRGRVGPMPVPTLRFIGNNIGGPGDILYAEVSATKQERAAVSAILGHVASTWSVGKWELGYLSPSSPTWRAASNVLGDGFVPPGVLPSVPYSSVDLPADWESYLASLTSNTRSSYRRGLRRLDAQGQLKVVVDTSPAGARRRMDELIRNHRRWLGGTEKEGWFGDEAVGRFLVDSAELLARDGHFLSSALELDGVPIAWLVGPSNGRTYFEQKSSYDRMYSRDSPGLVLGLELIRELIARGFRRVELGPGSTLYKKRLGGVEKPYVPALGYQGWIRRAVQVHARLRRRQEAMKRSPGAPGPDLRSPTRTQSIMFP
jgi:Acetyltransferase (GNAT) domain